MTLRDLIASLRKHIVIVLVMTVLLTSAAVVLSKTATPVYKSSASLYFSLGVGQSASDLNQGSNYTQAQMQSFAQLATMPVVLNSVISQLGLDMTAAHLAKSVSVSRPQDTSILEVSFSSADPERAAVVANATAAKLKGVVEELALRDANGRSTVVVRVVKAALPAQYPISPNTKRNVAGGLIAGLLLGVLVAYLRDALDTRVRRPEDVSTVADVPVLGQIGRAPKRRRTDSDAAISPEQAEEFRRLRTNLQFLDVDADGLCLVMSSAMSGEGKSTVSVNLALALAEADMSVLLIDADMRRPRIAEYLGIEGAAGLTTVLIGRATVEDVIQPWSDQRIDVLASGQVPPNPSELIATRTLRSLLEAMRAKYDVVLIDAPPLLPVADAAVLSRMASGVVVVADTRRVRRQQLHEVVTGVHAAGGTVLGVVLNRVKTRSGSAYGYASEDARDRGRRGRRRWARRRQQPTFTATWQSQPRPEKHDAAHVAPRPAGQATSATAAGRNGRPAAVIPVEPVPRPAARATKPAAASGAAVPPPTVPTPVVPTAPAAATDTSTPATGTPVVTQAAQAPGAAAPSTPAPSTPAPSPWRSAADAAAPAADAADAVHDEPAADALPEAVEAREGGD